MSRVFYDLVTNSNTFQGTMINLSIKPADLRAGAINTEAVTRDWSEGYTETWEYVQCPDCPTCNESCVFGGQSRLATIAAESIVADGIRAGATAVVGGMIRRDELDVSCWRCGNPECKDFATEVDPYEVGADGPMFNAGYPLPSLGKAKDAEEAAELVRHLPLCIVTQDSGEDESYELALTGAGMDFSWEIVEGFVSLGFLPPLAFADLPGMAGRGTSRRDTYLIEACIESSVAVAMRAARIANSLRARYTKES